MRKILDTLVVNAGADIRVKNVIRHTLASDVRFNSNYEGLRVACRIADAIEKEGDLLIEDGDWEKLCDALRSPSPMNGFTPYLLQPAYKQLELNEQILKAEIVKTTSE